MVNVLTDVHAMITMDPNSNYKNGYTGLPDTSIPYNHNNNILVISLFST